MDGEFIAFLIGVVVGGILMAVAISDDYSTGTDAAVLIEVCEQTLPRNSNCVLTAVVENEHD